MSRRKASCSVMRHPALTPTGVCLYPMDCSGTRARDGGAGVSAAFSGRGLLPEEDAHAFCRGCVVQRLDGVEQVLLSAPERELAQAPRQGGSYRRLLHIA